MFNTGAVVSALAQALSQQTPQQPPAQRPTPPPGAPAQGPPIQTSPWHWNAPPNQPVPGWFHGFSDRPAAGDSFATNPYYQHNIYSEGDHNIGAVMEALQRELLQRSSPGQSPDPDIMGLSRGLGVDWRDAQRYRNNMNTT